MKFTPKIEKAIKKASVLHHGQLRKDIEAIPYIAHPYAVAMLISDYTNDEDVIAAALLHDTVEDTDYSPEDVEKDFGKKVREIVEGVTEPKLGEGGQKLPWKVRKQAYLDNLESDSQESLMLCAADKICNMQNLVDGLAVHGRELFKGFASTQEERYWYHAQVLKVLQRRLTDKAILEKYEELLPKTK